ncbi:MAG: TrbI/VirB10 family protein [Treponema sp.]|nr:TrbI/VirB10 family protein [Treponema sp.]
MENNENRGQEQSADLFDSDTTLETKPVNLLDEINNEEEELLPPETDENEAREFNAGTAFGVIFLVIVVIIMIVMVVGSRKSKKKVVQKELDKAGTKYEVEFKEKYPVVEEIKEKEETDKEEVTEENIDNILNSLPTNLQPQANPAPAPVSPVGSSSSRETRNPNSKSPRRIDGLKGQGNPSSNQNTVNSVLNGNYPSAQNGGQRLTKEEYIAQMMKQTKDLQNQMYGSGGGVGAYSNDSARIAAAYQQNKEQFYSNGNGAGGSGQFMPYNSLWDGTIISGALVTAINTDNPGVVIARVTENVYSSYDHSFLLIPEGSLLYATYNSSISYGQNKVQVAWNLLIRPDGYRCTLGNMNGVNAQGVSGYKGRVTNHPFETLKALGMVGIYSMIQTEAMNDIKTTNNQYLQNAMSDMYRETAKIGNKIIDRALDIKPTISIKAGTEIKLITNVPLELPPVQINQVTRKYVRTR